MVHSVAARSNLWSQVTVALSRARLGILAVTLTHILSIAVGAIMVHSGNRFALDYRDNLIQRARAANPSLLEFRTGNRWGAALWDFGGNLYAGLANSAGGLSILMPFPFVAYRGWIGGIVSVDSQHESRLSTLPEGAYYLVTLALQLTPYSIAVGMGVNLGINYFRPRACYQGEKWYGLPKEALRDILRAYLLVVPLYLAASLWEFFMR